MITADNIVFRKLHVTVTEEIQDLRQWMHIYSVAIRSHWSFCLLRSQWFYPVLSYE